MKGGKGYVWRQWEWRPGREDRAAISRGRRKENRAREKLSNEVAASMRLVREEKKWQIADDDRVANLGTIDGRTGPDTRNVRSRMGLSGNLNWLDTMEFTTSASADLGGAP